MMTNNNPNQVVAIEFRGDKVFLRLADGREIGNPLNWHLWLAEATLAQREQVELYELSAYWPDLDNGLDAEEMMKGMPPYIARRDMKLTT
ncbi:MAG: DUF2442 domain-containing protein [Chloroflexi bacterium]|nr:DUF2442 domain-containing protein [Chloroflexota bacterium]MCC6893678.1 DUF2442 domain-containing protein [Anaerolineae bacterium]